MRFSKCVRKLARLVSAKFRYPQAAGGRFEAINLMHPTSCHDRLAPDGHRDTRAFGAIYPSSGAINWNPYA
jgi:hypothetical protein